MSDASGNTSESRVPHRFVWPPRPVEVKAPATGESEAPPVWIDVEAGLPRSTWSHIERTWLGLMTPPFDERAREMGWSPDEAGAYCRRCGQTVGRYETNDSGCSHCENARLPWQRIVRLGEYVSPLADFVREIKFTAFRHLGTQLGRELGIRLGRAVRDAQAEGKLAKDVKILLVPVPSSFRRRVSRGIDHAAVIARAAAGGCGGKVWPALGRAHRPAQVSMSASMRARNVAGSMRPTWLARMKCRRWKSANPAGNCLIIIVDDVTTTGATLREASRAVRGMFGSDGPPIWAAVLAATPVSGPA